MGALMMTSGFRGSLLIRAADGSTVALNLSGF
jgi:hypothetical protein